jgi:Na+/melibiose symporter-like transporter
MLENGIIAFIVGGAFIRAGQEYGKNGWVWGAIGLASFFVPSLVVPILVLLVLRLSGANRDIAFGSFNLTGLLGFAVGVGATVWTYNKLMERAIDAQAAKDAQELATAAQKPGSAFQRTI